MKRRVALLNVAGLSPRHLERADLMPHLTALSRQGAWRPLRPSFPAVTCSVQATLLTGKTPAEHGIIANGYYDREAHEVRFWEQSASLVQQPRLWELLPGCKTAVLFWQNSMFIQAEVVVTPRPLHMDHEFIQWCYSKPVGYYEQLQAQLKGFKLQSYWGPLAGLASSRWIAQAAHLTWQQHRPDLLLVYLPHLDYAAQKFGPDASQTEQACREIDAVLGELMQNLPGATVLVCSEYALAPVRAALFPNRLLRAAGLLRVREIAGREYLDLELSEAFAMVDHQVAHVYCRPQAVTATRQVLAAAGIGFQPRLDHPRSGELVAVAPADQWFAYYWWNDWNKAPGFAHSVDIHRKPGYDPCELWFDWPHTLRHFWRFPPATGIRPELVRGSHGRVDADPNGWAVLVADAQAAGVLPGQAHLEATELAPLVCRLLGETTGAGR